MAKTKSITVSWPWYGAKGATLYKVEKITNSTEYHPTQMLSKDAVDSLCHNREWTVNIIHSK